MISEAQTAKIWHEIDLIYYMNSGYLPIQDLHRILKEVLCTTDSTNPPVNTNPERGTPMTNSFSLEENEESAVSGECDESENTLLSLLESENQRLRQLLKFNQDIIRALNELIMSMQGQLDLLKREVAIGQNSPPEKLPAVG